MSCRTSGIATAVALLVAGCGFLDPEPFDGRRIGDGIGPWDDLGAVALCLGTHQLGPPNSAPGGMCGDPAQPSPPCLADSDCASRESCVCGRCSIQYCTSNADCGPNRVCTFGGIDGNRCDRSCSSSAECAPSETCSQHRCIANCSQDSQCQQGERCATIGFQRRCVVRSCNEDDDCVRGDDICKLQREPRLATAPTALARRAPNEPAVTLYVELAHPELEQRRAIYRAISNDGQHFRIDPATPVIEHDDNAVHAPSVVRTSDRWYLYYEVGDRLEIRVAESSDGITFEDSLGVLEAAGAPGAVLLSDQEVAVYYEVRSEIAVATGAPGAALRSAGSALAPAQVTDPPANGELAGQQFWLDIASVGSPHAVMTATATGESSLRIWFSAFGKESADSLQLGEVVAIPANFSVGYALASPDSPGLLTVWPYNPIFDRIASFVDHLSEMTPVVVQLTDSNGRPQESYLLYYLGGDASGTTLGTLGVARNGE